MFEFKDVYINKYYSLAGPLEKENNLKNCNFFIKDYYYGTSTIEKAESKMQKTVLNNLLKNKKTDIVIASDITNQLTASALGTVGSDLPYMGQYSACASFSSIIMTLGSFLMSKHIKDGVCLISSHCLAAEKQFRFPVEYGAPKPKRSSQTATAAVGILISSEVSDIKVVNGMFGKVIDSGVKDAHNMGGIMAIGAVDTLIRYLNKSKTKISDYDVILTGDLGKTGTNIFKEVLQQNHNIKINNHIDAGGTIYKNFEYSGASGPAVLPLILVTKILKRKKYKKILCLATGSLHSTLLVNQKNSIPTVTHAIYLEVNK